MKLLAIIATLLFTAVSPAFAISGDRDATTYPLKSVQQAKSQGDETRMALEGAFVRSHRGEEDEFIFRDTAGKEILVYDRDAGRHVKLNTPVIIEGAIDRGNLFRREFNLHRVIAAAPPTS